MKRSDSVFDGLALAAGQCHGGGDQQRRPEPAPGEAQNPIIWADVPDCAVIRVGDTYYMSSTTMHLSPGTADHEIQRPGELDRSSATPTTPWATMTR